jgi:hypothetical protein
VTEDGFRNYVWSSNSAAVPLGPNPHSGNQRPVRLRGSVGEAAIYLFERPLFIDFLRIGERSEGTNDSRRGAEIAELGTLFSIDFYYQFMFSIAED